MIADPAGLARCSQAQFARSIPTETYPVNECPASSAIGVATVTFDEPEILGFDTVTAPIFNLAPLGGEPARFGVKVLGVVSMFLDTAIRSGGDYGVTLSSDNITETAWMLSLKLTFWGVPGDRRHDNQRGWECLKQFGACAPSTATIPPPFLSLGTACGEPLLSTVAGDSWAQAEPRKPTQLASYQMGPLDGCDRLPFEPEIKISPDVHAASEPTGLNVDVHVPQIVTLPTLPEGPGHPGLNNPDPEGLGESAVKDITIALPEGVAINPAAAGGSGSVL